MSRELPIDQIDIRSDARAIDAPSVAALVDSIGTVGLINPIRVRSVNGRWEVIAGAHRLTACRELGLVEIESIIVDDDDLHAELAMIDENLCRAELSPADRAKQTVRRKEIYEELHPEAKAGNVRAQAANIAMGHDVDDNLTPTFTQDTSNKTGADIRRIQRDVARGQAIVPSVLEFVAGTEIDTASFLDELRKARSADQMQIAKRKLASVRAEKRDRNAAKIQADIKARAAREIAEIIADHVPSEWFDAIKSNLYAAGAKNIGDAFSNIVGESVMDRSAA